MADLLLEILSEEIPARMQARAAEDLARLVGESLKAQGLEAKKVEAFAGPRRVTFIAQGLPNAQPDTTEERKGPQVGAPEQALQGFMRAAGLTSIDQAEVRDLPKGKFYFSVVTKKGRPTTVVLKEVIEGTLAQMPWPKSMRWASNPVRWVRPLQGILCILDGKVVPISFAGVEAGDTTVGHRFLAPDPIKVRSAADYEAKLEKAYVVLRPEKRAESIESKLAKLAASEGVSIRPDAGLLNEVLGLVEWPVPLLGTIDAAFMDVPAEAMTSAMRKHQKYFALSDKSGAFANRFGVIANMETQDKGRAIIAGNERVLRARLSDAKFFWDEDRKQKLESRVGKLEERVFQAALGTVYDKVKRLVKLAANLAKYVPGADPAQAERAALLSKADLSTGMVGEFPDLQGVMGRYYALHDGEPDAIADAIAEHYSPLGPNDACPSKPLSVAVSLADKIDSLVGFFAIDEKPTGSKDPYALRRAALGVIRIILENKLRLPLRAAFTQALAPYNLKTDAKMVSDEVLDFFADRLKVYLREKGVRHDYVSAVFALGNEDDLVRLMARVDALGAFLATDDGANLLVAHRRAANIVRIEEKKDGASHSGEVTGDGLGAPEATFLLDALDDVKAPVWAALDAEDFGTAMAQLARLRAPVDAFFEKVTVNSDNADHRAARLRLLSRIGAVMGQVAEFSRVEG